jgi:hypothetical protein
MQNGDFIVFVQDAVAEGFADLADALHAEGRKFGGAQCADAGAAIDVSLYENSGRRNSTVARIKARRAAGK